MYEESFLLNINEQIFIHMYMYNYMYKGKFAPQSFQTTLFICKQTVTETCRYYLVFPKFTMHITLSPDAT